MSNRILKIKDIKYCFEPTMIGLIVTDECTASCNNCCFNCSPKKGISMSLEDMKYYVNSGIENFKEIKTVVLTGGEPFLLGIKQLKDIINHINKLNLRSRIVTNGFWATHSKTKEYICELVASGLNEINFSTGDEHQKFVNIENIINACIESVKSGLTVAVNIESHEKSCFNINTLFENSLFKEFFSNQENINKIKIVSGIWSSLNEDSNSYDYNLNNMELLKKRKKGCNSIFKSISILPSGEMTVCCGLTVTKIAHFKLGNVKTDNMKTLYETQYNCFINLWLKMEGPYNILEYLALKEPRIKELHVNHSCQACNYLFNNEFVKETISKYYIEKIPEVLFKYQIQKKLNNF